MDGVVDGAAALRRARALAVSGRRRILGLVGPPAAGKSTLAAALSAELGPTLAAALPLDGFHLADVALRSLGRLDRKGAPDTFDAAGYVALLHRLRAGEPGTVWAPAFERTLEQPLAGSIAVPADVPLVITEGNYLLLDTGAWAGVRAQLDEVWWVESDPAVRGQRLLARHVEFGKAPDEARAWMAAVDEPNAALIEATRGRADAVVSW